MAIAQSVHPDKQHLTVVYMDLDSHQVALPEMLD